ncbi:FmdB family zinc ribbon protein [Planctomicrobium sp. SH661]|uniref:FmdB family zinc ribbon protein n=1 Tax=Planctomicrobium sp. SH661 TaxID=3448124 RepID=UPI003F5C9E0E
MPNRDYRCEECGHECEELSARIKRTCPSCHHKTLQVVFKQLPVYHDRYSPMHPRKGRGRG